VFCPPQHKSKQHAKKLSQYKGELFIERVCSHPRALKGTRYTVLVQKENKDIIKVVHVISVG